MKVFILTDMEGAAGITSTDMQCVSSSRYLEQSKKLLTGEVNAAVEGFFAEGGKEALVFDAHGPGGIDYESLHEKAVLLHGRPLARWDVIREVTQRHDLAFIIGQHAMAGVERSVLNHTQSSVDVEYFKLNGKFIGETAQFALFCGALNVPVVFLAGDHEACREAQELIPGIVTVAVKEGLSRTCAISLPPAEAQRRISAGVRAALQKHKQCPIAPLVWKPPFVLEKRFFHTNIADIQYGKNIHVERVDAKTVRLQSDNILDVIYA